MIYINFDNPDKRVDAKRQHLKTRDGDDKLFCGGVPSDFTDGQLAEFFSSYGMVNINFWFIELFISSNIFLGWRRGKAERYGHGTSQGIRFYHF